MQRTCAELASAQLSAYNAMDLDAFCDCYAEDVRVLDAEGRVTLESLPAFRERYAGLFGGWDAVGATVATRLVLEPHAVDDETWWRSRQGERHEGRVLVRYTARAGRIALVEFLREES
ncbi:MAG: nuclear transport factor 2 family protein [Deltaproteobacteria bacterium]|nr:nuclear transport factor 2 family protein [Deltaproteobacteria bacterium]